MANNAHSATEKMTSTTKAIMAMGDRKLIASTMLLPTITSFVHCTTLFPFCKYLSVRISANANVTIQAHLQI